VLRSDPEFPFCGERCRLIDLGKWASGGYVISTPINDPDDLDALGYQGPKAERSPQSKQNDTRKDVQ
jgi:endogenous inhibitor of DNA gyrase (YacG/DUF329 family)